MRICRGTVLLVASLSLNGCISFDTVVKVNPDGSGQVVQTTLMSKVMVQQLSTMLQAMTEQLSADSSGSKAPPEFFGEEEARRRAAQMGEGVTYLSSRKVQTDRFEGIEAVYAFQDINRLQIDSRPSSPLGEGSDIKFGPSIRKSSTAFKLSQLDNGNSLLTVRLQGANDNVPHAPTQSSPPNSAKPETQASPEQVEQFKKLIEGLRLSLAVEVLGTLVKTNSTYVEGSRVTLMEMEFAELLSNEPKLKEMASFKTQSLEDAKRLLAGLKGFKVSLDPEIRIEFSSK
ncbi:MAG: hypothetical protein AB1898_13760 [Acidobacteriota bacterium]